MPEQTNELQEEEATEEQQQQYDIIVGNVLTFINGEKSSASVDKMISNAEQQGIPETVGMVTAQLVVQQLDAAKAAGTQLDTGAVFNAGAEVVEELIEVGMREHFFTFADEADLVAQQEKALVIAQQKIAETAAQAGLLDQETVKREVADLIREEGPKKIQKTIASVQSMIDGPAQAPQGQGTLASESENG